MVVEDNDFVRMQLMKFMSEAGYSVIEARSGDQVPARDPAKGPLKPLEDAPGSFVLVLSDD